MSIPRNDFNSEGRSIFDDPDEAMENRRARKEEGPPLPQSEHIKKLELEDAEFTMKLLRGEVL